MHHDTATQGERAVVGDGTTITRGSVAVQSEPFNGERTVVGNGAAITSGSVVAEGDTLDGERAVIEYGSAVILAEAISNESTATTVLKSQFSAFAHFEHPTVWSFRNVLMLQLHHTVRQFVTIQVDGIIIAIFNGKGRLQNNVGGEHDYSVIISGSLGILDGAGQVRRRGVGCLAAITQSRFQFTLISYVRLRPCSTGEGKQREKRPRSTQATRC